ncbi:hypothetical protein E2N92_07415 [Methanofollis formosanus]|uniref:Uncharacterized protein n=1 Tax=Methanofollis formosanus TaxID=299308 RepID=A0A8G1EGU4_9EURY|nr:hypothetical protein [Methanofollis formosanus]QYZ79277.1 hypothetical protein E2N92_07415 [Methanofollis formosanus]
MRSRTAVLMIALLLLLAAPALAVPGEKGNVHEKGWAKKSVSSQDEVITPIATLAENETGDIPDIAENETEDVPEIAENETDQEPVIKPTKRIPPGIAKRLPQDENAKPLPPGLAKRIPSAVNETNGTVDLSENFTWPPSTWKNRNQVSTAVHTLLAAGEMDGGIGENISAIAREFNTSVQTRMMAEQQIQERQGLTRLLFGGDQEAVAALCQNLNRTSDQIREMQRLVENCTCDNQTRTLLMEQLTVMEEEQARLSALVQNETDDQGLFGWLIP